MNGFLIQNFPKHAKPPCTFTSHVDHLCYITQHEIFCPNSQRLISPLNQSTPAGTIPKLRALKTIVSPDTPATVFNTFTDFVQLQQELQQRPNLFIQAVEMGLCHNSS